MVRFFGHYFTIFFLFWYFFDILCVLIKVKKVFPFYDFSKLYLKKKKERKSDQLICKIRFLSIRKISSSSSFLSFTEPLYSTIVVSNYDVLISLMDKLNWNRNLLQYSVNRPTK